MTDSTTEYKVCTKCEVSYPATTEYFLRNRGGLRTECKVCRRALKKTYYAENSDKVLAHMKDYYAENRDKVLARAKAYAAEHREERRSYKKTYYVENSDKVLARAKAYAAEHREERRSYNKTYSKTYRAEHREEIRAYNKTYAAENPDKIRARGKAYRAKNREEIRAYAKAYHAENRDKARTKSRNRRARELSNGGSHTAADIRLQYDSQNGLCYYCDLSLNRKYHVDHVIPLKKGGSNDPSNLVCSCSRCNLTKHARTLEEWLCVIDDAVLYQKVQNRIIQRSR